MNIVKHVLWAIVAVWGCGPAVFGEAPSQADSPWRAGVASIDLTPTDPVWLDGYAGRKHPSEGVARQVYAKALALQDPDGTRFVVVTLDLVSVPRYLRQKVEQEIERAYGLKPEYLLLNASHTHAAPALRLASERTPYAIPPVMWERLLRYRKEVEEKIIGVVGKALSAGRPASLTFSRARAGFAMNRRSRAEDGRFINHPNADGLVDHEVPVLAVRDPAGSVKALLFGYACHNTTVNAYQISADYAGYAQSYLEEAYPGAIALFMQGCGGDQNPYPRHGVSGEEWAAQHGQALANGVKSALLSGQLALKGDLRAAYTHVPLKYRYLTVSELEQAHVGNSPELQARAEAQLKRKQLGELPVSYPCPVQVLRIGNEFTLVALGHEVVVDYSLRLKRELRGKAGSCIWIAGYSNDVRGYIGSRRILEEGGYEGVRANLAVGHPAPYDFSTEEDLVAEVHRLVERLAR